MKSSFFDVHGHMHTGVLWLICVHWDRVGTIWALADALLACGTHKDFREPIRGS